LDIQLCNAKGNFRRYTLPAFGYSDEASLDDDTVQIYLTFKYQLVIDENSRDYAYQ